MYIKIFVALEQVRKPSPIRSLSTTVLQLLEM